MVKQNDTIAIILLVTTIFLIAVGAYFCHLRSNFPYGESEDSESAATPDMQDQGVQDTVGDDPGPPPTGDGDPVQVPPEQEQTAMPATG